MIRIAGERIIQLFALAESESRSGPGPLPDRYVRLARRIGTRYNVRVPRELSDRFCRGCSSYWIEGRSVRTRLRSGRRTQTCLSCGRVRRVLLGDRAVSGSQSWSASRIEDAPLGAALVDDSSESEDGAFETSEELD